MVHPLPTMVAHVPHSATWLLVAWLLQGLVRLQDMSIALLTCMLTKSLWWQQLSSNRVSGSCHLQGLLCQVLLQWQQVTALVRGAMCLQCSPLLQRHTLQVN